MTTSVPDLGCAAQRLALGEPLPGTAPERAASWLLVEHPGPWPARGWPDGLAAPVARALEQAGALGVRPQLVRRVAGGQRDRAAGDRPVVAVASCRPADRWLETRVLHDPGELAELDLTAVAAGSAPGWGARTEAPLLLVCTNGKRDVCCARRGRPVAQVLDALLPGLVWETSHVGGDRFAANVVTLPSGTYHGGLDATSAPLVAAAAREGRVVVDHLRGTAGLPSAVQAAEAYARRELGLADLDAVRGEGQVLVLEDGLEAVRVVAGDRAVEVRLRRRQVPDVRLTTCSGGGAYDRPHVRELVGVVELVVGAAA